MPAGIGGRFWVENGPAGVGVKVGFGVAVAAVVAVAVAVGGIVAVGGTGVTVAVGGTVAVKVADGKTALVTVGGVRVGLTGPHDASRIASATPIIIR